MIKDWENLHYFLSVARHGTVSGAAKELGVSHSTVVRRIEHFEQGLGTKLFRKLQRGYELSPAGEQLFSNGQPVEGDINKILSQAAGQFDVTAGTLRISQPELDCLDRFYSIYAEYSQLNPDVSFEIYSTTAVHNITQQEVDIALRAYPVSISPPDTLIGRSLGSAKLGIFATQKYLDQFGKDYSLSDLDWVVWRTRSRLKEIWLQSKIANPRIIFSVDKIVDVISAVRHHMGATIMSEFGASQYPDLVRVNDLVVKEYQLWLLTHRDLRNSERVMNFMRFLTDNLKFE